MLVTDGSRLLRDLQQLSGLHQRRGVAGRAQRLEALAASLRDGETQFAALCADIDAAELRFPVPAAADQRQLAERAAAADPGMFLDWLKQSCQLPFFCRECNVDWFLTKPACPS